MPAHKLLTREMHEFLTDLAGPGFYGRIDIEIENGEIKLVRKGQKIRPEKKLTGTDYSGTISIVYESGQIVFAEKIERIDI